MQNAWLFFELIVSSPPTIKLRSHWAIAIVIATSLEMGSLDLCDYSHLTMENIKWKVTSQSQMIHSV